MKSQNVALWDINIALWVIFLFIVTQIFHLWKITYLTLSNELDLLCGFGKTIRFGSSVSILQWQIVKVLTLDFL